MEEVIHSPSRDIRGEELQDISEDDESTVELVDVELGANLLDSIADMTSLSAFVNPDSEGGGSGHRTYNTEDDCRLSLAYGRFNTVPRSIIARTCSYVQILDLSHNKISDLIFLTEFPNLTSLILDNNPITEHSNLPIAPNLRLLWMNRCRVACLFPWVRRMHLACPRLRHLSLMGNPAAPSYLNGGTFYEYLQYRLFVVSLFPRLVHLDDRRVSRDQRTEAHRLYRRPLFERLLGLGSPGGESARGEASAVISTIVPESALSNWRALHGKVANMFEQSMHTHRPTRNLVI